MTLDRTAQGDGWFIDPTPHEDAEFSNTVAAGEFHAPRNSPAFGRIDLLTVVAHELGHVLGLPDLDEQAHPHAIMDEFLLPGVRRVPVGEPDAMAAPSLPRVPRALSPTGALESLLHPAVVKAQADLAFGLGGIPDQVAGRNLSSLPLLLLSKLPAGGHTLPSLDDSFEPSLANSTSDPGRTISGSMEGLSAHVGGSLEGMLVSDLGPAVWRARDSYFAGLGDDSLLGQAAWRSLFEAGDWIQ